MQEIQNETPQDEVSRQEQRNQEIRDFGKVFTHSEANIQSIMIAGQIEGHVAVQAPAKATKYEHIIPELVFAEENPEVDGVLFLIHTVGGDVEAGLAMAEMIRGMKKPTVSLILGGGHSIGIPLAVAAKKTFMVKSATMTVHPVRINGLILGAPQSWEYLHRMQDRISDFIVENSRCTRERLDTLMAGRSDMATDIGSILDGREAVQAGLIDELASFSKAMQNLKKMIRKMR